MRYDPALHDPVDNARLLRLVSLASVLTALLLIGVKSAAWVLTDSVSLLASLVDSVMDSAASIVNFIAIRFALTPADDDHRYGHGKAEALAGLGQAAFIAGSAVFLMIYAVDRILHPVPVADPGTGIAVMLFSILATGALVLFQRHVIRRTRSTAISADSLHYVGDLLVNVSIIIALLAAGAGYLSVDAWMGIAIACYIVWNAWEIVRDSLVHLLDREVGEDVREEILRIAGAQPQVRGVHDLRTRLSGQQMFVQLHMELDRDLPLWRAHETADAVEHAIRKRFPASDVIVHQDPVPVVPVCAIPGEH